MPIHDEMRGRKEGNPTRLIQKKPVEPSQEPPYPWDRVYRTVKPKSAIKPFPAPSQRPDPFHPNLINHKENNAA